MDYTLAMVEVHRDSEDLSEDVRAAITGVFPAFYEIGEDDEVLLLDVRVDGESVFTVDDGLNVWRAAAAGCNDE